MTRARYALVVAALLAGCGVKAPPRPPVKEGVPPAGAAAPACETCGAGAPPVPTPRTP